jgi:hypothetical protein
VLTTDTAHEDENVKILKQLKITVANIDNEGRVERLGEK